MPKTKRGRPSQGLSETQALIRLPAELDGLVRAAAREDGVTLSEWWRAAAHLALLSRARERGQQ